jgi:hypothetical protein
MAYQNLSSPSAAVINEQDSIRTIQKNVVAENTVLPIVYGEAQVGGKIFAIQFNNDDLVFTIGYALAAGEIDSVVEVFMDNEPPPAEVTINYYTGTQDQTADPLLSAEITGYNDDLPGVAYIVIQFGIANFSTWPQVLATVRGRKVYNPSNGLTEFSSNPVLHLADFISNSDFGIGKNVDWDSVEVAADYADDTTLGEVRRESFCVINKVNKVDKWSEILRSYSSCFVVYDGDTAYFIADKVTASTKTFTASDIVQGSLKITKKDSSNLPNSVQVKYTDDSSNQWKERKSDFAEYPGVGTSEPRRLSIISMPGIRRHSQAYREAVERLNKLALSDLEVTFDVFDEGLEVQLGDVITVSHPFGLTSKQFRVISTPASKNRGRWTIKAQEYDAAAYSDEIITQSSTPDTDLPTDQTPAPPTDIVLTEDSYQTANGLYASRIKISWTPSASSFVTGYEVRVLEAGNIVWATTVDSTSVSTSPLKELTPYIVEVRSRTALYISDPLTTSSISLIGKSAIPLPPTNLSGFEAGGEVRLHWNKSTDLDAERYEIRYSDKNGNWDNAIIVDETDALRATLKNIPPSAGQTDSVWRFYVKTIDSIKQKSDFAAFLDIAVTSDDNAFIAGEIPLIEDITNQSQASRHFENRNPDVEVWYSDSGETWSDLFGSSAMSTFTNPLVQYQTLSGTAYLYTEELDLLQNRSGTFISWPPVSTYYGGDGTWTIGIKENGSPDYDYISGLLAVGGTARYARLRLDSLYNFKVELPFGFIRADVVTRTEEGVSTSSASGPTTVTLNNVFSAVRSLNITPSGSQPRTAVYDNIVLGNPTTFDVYIFDTSNDQQLAVEFSYAFKGLAFGDPSGNFVLQTGYWNDEGIWIDGAPWDDGS